MEASARPPCPPTQPKAPDIEKLKQNLIKKGVFPTPKIIHTLRKKELQKSARRLAKQAAKQPPSTAPYSSSHESFFQTVKSEYKSFNKAIEAKGRVSEMVGNPWEGTQRLKMKELARRSREYDGDDLRELGDLIESESEKFRWLLDEDIEFADGWFQNEKPDWSPPRRRGGEAESIRFLVERLSNVHPSVKNAKFCRAMKHSQLQFTEGQMLKIVEGLGQRGHWGHAMCVVNWLYQSKEHKHYKSRFVYTKLLTVLGQARRPNEALQVFNMMRRDRYIYPDMAAYHSIAVALGQAGRLKDLISIIDLMKQKPKKINIKGKNWDPVLEPDVVVLNSVLNACIQSNQWKGVYWVFDQLRKNGLKPNGATYGLAMEVMLQSGKYEHVHEYFDKMKRSGEAVKAITYKVLVKSFWEEGKVKEAVRVVRDMEQRGIVGTTCVYYELARCLCYHGKWEEAMLEIERLRNLRQSKRLEVAFTGMILSSLDGGQVDGCIFIFERSKNYCTTDIGMINAMLKVYGRNDMFLEAKELFEVTMRESSGHKDCANNGPSLNPDEYTFSAMLQTCASALQWEYFEFVYKEMALVGYLLDQHKHAALLVEASKAGKGGLLEHAFEMILEAGEVPNLAFFTEMVCQALICSDYERAVSIVSTMAHASFQVSDQQWIDLFKENDYRISKNSLKELLDSLRNHDLKAEATISNLSRALQSVCKSFNSEEFSEIIFTENATSIADASNPFRRNQVGKVAFSDSIYDEQEDKFDLKMVSELSSSQHLEERNSTSTLSSQDNIFDRSSISVVDNFQSSVQHDLLDEDVDELELELETMEESYNDSEPDTPSAHEILKTWEEMREDAIFLPFRHAGGDTKAKPS